MEKEQAKLQELRAQVASTSKRGHAQRFELWTALLPEIKDTIKKILRNHQVEEEHINSSYQFNYFFSQYVIRFITFPFVIHYKIHCASIFFNTDEANEEENVDPDHAFEHVRQLLLSRKITEAVTYMWKVCTKLEEGPDVGNLSSKAKEDCLFAFLLKIFIESENTSTDSAENEDINDAEKLEIDKRKEEISKRKRVIDYLKVCNIQTDIAIFL